MTVLVNYSIFSIKCKARLLLGFSILGFLSCQDKSEPFEIKGYTMGTTYSIVYIQDQFTIGKARIQHKVDSVLNRLNQQMSTYIADSEISKFNSIKNTNTVTISSEFSEVVHRAQDVSRLSKGVFDITIMPLVRLWGFGPGIKGNHTIPSEKEIDKVKKNIGFEQLISFQNTIKKLNPEIEIDLNAIAKGFAVDCISDLLETLKIDNYLVEVGGEIRCGGKKKDGKSWTVGIDKPELENQMDRRIETVLNVSNSAVATSGDYRNFFKIDDIIYSHVINPNTGFPVQNRVASATVIAPHCTEADAWATALLVLGKKGVKMIEDLDNYEAIIFIREGNSFQKIMTSSVDEMFTNH
jgi:thiamine biosynthesis lipoprotein|tara:strand:+ start:114 stop:1172 length:1059 start_codon:yes stop_codon:yes gene_type:complete